MKIKAILSAFMLMSTTVFAQSDFTLGADMGWLTQYESQGWKCYDRMNQERECMSLMADYGITAERIRVWVNPEGRGYGKWCAKEDVLEKCKRAKALGQDIMIDFHYSDWWADPGKQNIPKAWEGHNFKQMKKDVAEHTKEVLTYLRDNDISVRWVQVGNETSNGMLWTIKMDPKTGWEWKDENGKTKMIDSMGHIGGDTHQPKQYAGFFKAGYDAVKSVYPNAIVIVHLDNGFDNKLYNWNLDILRKNGAKFDMIGMSLYPYWSIEAGKEPTAEKTITDCINNINLLTEKYGVDVMITETGYLVDERHPEVMIEGRDQLRRLIRESKNLTNGRCKGVFYWEPECRPSQYKLGAFTEDGHPTAIMDGFLSDNRVDTLTANHPEYLPGFKNGEMIPEFEAKDTLGNTIKLSDFRGKYVVIDFWATWCKDCRYEMPFLKQLYKEYQHLSINGKPVQWIGYSFDVNAEAWKNILRKEKLAWPQVSTLKSTREDPTFKEFKLHWIPAFYLVDPEGKVVGSAITADGLRNLLEVR